jgi:peptidoglycan-associated lipoprotein
MSTATSRAFALLACLALGAGCQSTTATATAPSAGLEPPSAVGQMERPDTETLSPAARISPEEFVAVPRLVDIHFDFDAYAIRDEDVPVLEAHAAWLKANPTVLVLIEGHTDERGTSEYNLGLADLRAAAAMRYLIAQGVPAGRMVAISYGKERPLCTEHDETCWVRNRRASFLVKPH